jgi:hypothetical protein
MKILTKQERKQKLLELEHPNECFCDYDKHTYLNPIRKEMWSNHPLYQPKGKHETIIYKCEICGKEYNDEIVWA